MRFIKDMLAEDGQVSTTRFCVLTITITCCIIAIQAVCLDRDLSATAVLIGSLIGPAYALKGFQKRGENGQK